jgi:asparagine synthase (glutamine-hydrolysing)
MCGIVAVWLPNGRVDPVQLARMTGSLQHRGPDGSGCELPRPDVGLGHRRLSILDLAGGAQPMQGADARVWITFNGEIFNYRELRLRLERDGHRLRTASDTEVLVRMYEQHGTAAFAQLRGQFACAIWDGRAGEGRLVLARDPLGIKPLYWAWDGHAFLCASEPRALLLHPQAPRAVDPYGIHLFLRYRFIPAPHSAWVGIEKLLPGELVVVEPQRLRRERYWRLQRDEVEVDDAGDAAPALLRDELERAVRLQSVADVPVGAFLSGGLDSSTTAALLARQTREPIMTWTIGFADPRYDERPFAAAVAERIGSRHTAEVMDDEQVRSVVPEVLAQLDEPFGDPSLLPTWLLCRTAARHAKVAMSGDGSDELFGGYGRIYRSLGILARPRMLRPLHRVLRRIRRERVDPARWTGDDPRVDAEYERLLLDVEPDQAAALYGPRLAAARSDAMRQDPIRAALARHYGFPPFSRLLGADLEAHLADYHLVKVDRASMAHGLEVRVPFLDVDLVERAFRWTPRVRLSGGRSKGLLRDAVQPLLPEITLTRPKRGFGPPLKDWFRDDLGAVARRELLDGAAVTGGWLQRRELERMLDPAKRRPQGSRLWRLLVLEHWLRRQEVRA